MDTLRAGKFTGLIATGKGQPNGTGKPSTEQEKKLASTMGN
jgi:hypothetical protein